VVRGVARHARIHDLGTFLRPTYIPDRKAMRGFGAVGVVASVTSEAIWRQVRALKLPVVNVSTWLSELPVASVCPDNAAIGRLAAEYFLGRGFRHVGFYASSYGHEYAKARGGAFAETLTESGVEAIEIEPAGYSDDWRREVQRLARWLAKAPKPMAVFCATDEDGRHFAEVCRRGELRVPEEVAVLGVDNDEMLCEICSPPLSSIDTQAERIGYEAGAMLMRLLEGDADSDSVLRIPPAGVVERRSSDALAVADADVAAALHYIREHAAEPVRVHDVVAESQLSRRTLERRFTKAVGHSPADEIRIQHLERAKYLLAFTDWSLTRVAYGSGFRSFRHLAEVFRRELDCSPTAWRKQRRS
jgi:LacI family transcriptional regulator